MDPQLHAQDNLSHARWKVKFLGHLLHAHLRSSKKDTEEWQGRHAAMLQRLASAEDEVQLCQQALEALRPILDETSTPPPAGITDTEVKSELAPS